MADPSEKDGLTLSPKALVAVLGAALAVGGGAGVTWRTGAAQAGGHSEVAVAVLERRVSSLEKDRDDDRKTWRDDMKGINTKLDSIASRLPPVKP